MRINTTTTPITIRIAGSISASAAVSAVATSSSKNSATEFSICGSAPVCSPTEIISVARSGNTFVSLSESARLLPSRTVAIDVNHRLRNPPRRNRTRRRLQRRHQRQPARQQRRKRARKQRHLVLQPDLAKHRQPDAERHPQNRGPRSVIGNRYPPKPAAHNHQADPQQCCAASTCQSSAAPSSSPAACEPIWSYSSRKLRNHHREHENQQPVTSASSSARINQRGHQLLAKRQRDPLEADVALQHLLQIADRSPASSVVVYIIGKPLCASNAAESASPVFTRFATSSSWPAKCASFWIFASIFSEPRIGKPGANQRQKLLVEDQKRLQLDLAPRQHPPIPPRARTEKTWYPAWAKRARSSSAVAAVCTCSCTRPRSSANLMTNSAMPLLAGSDRPALPGDFV